MSGTLTAAVNYWPESSCARAFWGQHELPPYRELLADTTAWLDPQPGECWLDLGCGCGQLSKALWVKSAGRVRAVVGLDVAPANETAYRRMAERLEPAAADGQLRFAVGDLSAGLPGWRDGQLDGVVSGLAIQYAASYSEELGCWTCDAYDRILAEVHRVLRSVGRFVFSVNVPEPAWGKVAWRSVAGVFGARQPLHYLKKAVRMMSYGGWLKREARRGRFHYLPAETVAQKLAATGFIAIEHRRSYAGQAYVFRCRK
jgi:ubiquinone/menaquinone biosynthesis C-methylase UbiE